MAFWRANRLQKQAGWVPGLTVLTRPGRALQGIIAGTVLGVVLGIYTLGLSSLPPRLVPLFILAVLCPVIVLVVGNVRRLLLAAILLDIPLSIDMHLGYNFEAAALNAIGGLSVSITTISLLILYALWLGESLGGIKHHFRPKIWKSTTLSLAAYLAITGLSVVVARDVMLSLYEIVLLVQTFLLYIYIVATVRTRHDLLFIVTMLLLGLVLESMVMIGLKFVGHSISFAGISASMIGSRVGGTFGSPNAAASYLALFLAAAGGVLLTHLRRPYKWLAALAFGLGVVALIFTLSRGGWIGFVLSVIILCLLAWRRGWLSLSARLVIICSVLIISVLFQHTISARLLGAQPGAATAEGRLIMMELALKVIEDNPILGVGANNFALTIEQYATSQFSGAWLHVVHNKYLLVWAETGLGGLIAFLLFLAITIRWGWQCSRLNDRLLAPLALGLMAAILGQMAHMFLDLFNGRAQVQGLWVVASLITVISNIGRVGVKDVVESTTLDYK
jgi:putative inorganic carbon (HCO3(-)) transporter